MKNIRKLLAMALAVMMILSLAAPAFAADTYSITINNSAEGHTYEAYQIFIGDLKTPDAVDGEDALTTNVLSNIQWGANISDDGKTALQTKYDATDAAGVAGKLTTANIDEFAVLVENYLTGDPAGSTSTQTNGAYVIEGLNPGYYLVKDQDKSLAGDNDAYTKYIIEVIEDSTVKPKSSVPTFEKKVDDENDSVADNKDTEAIEGEDDKKWQDSADYDIGDKVPFQLKGTVASDYDEYTVYYFAFHDVEETGLTFDSTSVKVYVDGTEITSGFQVVTQPTDGCTFEVVFANLKTITSVKAGSVITVEYESTLNEGANIGSTGNVNKAKLEFSNNPNDEQGGEHGYTPWDNVIVFTYQVIVNKITADNKPLEGAEFKLEKKLSDNTYKEITVVKADSGTSFSFKGLDDGEYRLTETVTPAGYNTIEPITFTVNADHTITWNGENRNAVLTSLTGNAASGKITLTPALDNGSLTTDVINQSGATLPETGGMGTTIFYVLGAAMVLGAAVLLVTKKRMAA